MKAMVLAAGLGTRLQPLTNDRPKALVEISGRTLLDITLARLRAFGIHEVIINVHHFADMVVDFLKAHDNYGMRIEISREEKLLDTGGGLKKAAYFFLEGSAPSDEPFVLHNVDVISSIDLNRMVQAHKETRVLATLAVQQRETTRPLLFDKHLQLCGRGPDRNEKGETVRPCSHPQPFAFSGIHVISTKLLKQLSENGAFSIITSYLRLAAEGERVMAFRADEYYWRDLGRFAHVQQVEDEVKRQMVHLP
jgi:NDP-sugar pyrophosphorylase family protein